MGLSNANTCWCGDLFPAQSDQVSDSECDTPCNGYPDESCGGGSSYLTVWLTGLEADVGYFGGGSSGGDEGSGGDESSTVTSEPSPPPTSPTSSPTKMQTTPRPNRPRPTPSVVTSVAPGTTIVITNTPVPSSPASSTPTLKSSSGGGGSNVAGIAAGVVVGVVAVIAIATGIFFFIRHKRRKEAEEEYKRTQVSDFMRGGDKRPPPTGYSNMSDSRLDPEAGNRRDSHGSIADDQDFSRRILRVANPDTSGR
ncbi:Stress-activated PKC1-MPK1 kinase pathway sensor [Vermiconidia calcicola]|uniref:Stress-activated PKC1-MPK1 kinase pathway sensor n=1 Tax=Vermiconidia calcicola TaxID=1690605 RepID=A0ACC3NEZ9_9PEZI|nr:Stress-activated PKC1-MPK1 kinase pathway sensor [Vermiconidia calcicola]